jgi:enterochelin esterase-like enzyme
MKTPVLKIFGLIAACLLACPPTFGQTPPAPAAPPMSTVNADGSITFRLMYPSAKAVSVATDALLQPLDLTKDTDGLWSATTTVLDPEHYGYTFVVDGVHMLDPLNREVHPNFVNLYSDLLVPGRTPMPWELTDIPHGAVSKHLFTTHVSVHFPANQTAYVVYTPPGYDPKRRGGYPVLYLLHGYTDTEEGWILTGKANLMLDSLLAENKMVPMIVVMPRGYGDFDVVSHGTSPNAMGKDNIELFEKSLAEEIVPAIEREYNTTKGRENRAVVGLSMGGMEAVTAGLEHPELFAWVGGMSAALPRDLDARFPNIDGPKTNLKMLWIACGTDDRLIATNRAFVTWARTKNLPVTAVETPGAHTFPVWRNNLLSVAPLLFKK